MSRQRQYSHSPVGRPPLTAVACCWTVAPASYVASASRRSYPRAAYSTRRRGPLCPDTQCRTFIVHSKVQHPLVIHLYNQIHISPYHEYYKAHFKTHYFDLEDVV